MFTLYFSVNRLKISCACMALATVQLKHEIYVYALKSTTTLEKVLETLLLYTMEHEIDFYIFCISIWNQARVLGRKTLANRTLWKRGLHPPPLHRYHLVINEQLQYPKSFLVSTITRNSAFHLGNMQGRSNKFFGTDILGLQKTLYHLSYEWKHQSSST